MSSLSSHQNTWSIRDCVSLFGNKKKKNTYTGRAAFIFISDPPVSISQQLDGGQLCGNRTSLRFVLFSFFYSPFIILSYHVVSHGSILPSHHPLKQHAGETWGLTPRFHRLGPDNDCYIFFQWAAVYGDQVLGCVSVWAEHNRSGKIAPPVLLCCPASSWWDAVDRVWVSAVSVCILQREVEGRSHRFSIISSAPSTERSEVWLLSCYSMIHGIHLPECALGSSALWAKCPCKCGSSLCVCVCV